MYLHIHIYIYIAFKEKYRVVFQAHIMTLYNKTKQNKKLFRNEDMHSLDEKM